MKSNAEGSANKNTSDVQLEQYRKELKEYILGKRENPPKFPDLKFNKDGTTDIKSFIKEGMKK